MFIMFCAACWPHSTFNPPTATPPAPPLVFVFFPRYLTCGIDFWAKLPASGTKSPTSLRELPEINCRLGAETT